ncbi:MAG: hypothetical protein GAK35_02215 [Herbaspirillum frisingense]|uniref:Scaffolding-like protein n=1 Tax=Herbaspirillum frisingense TaxID=92645 RepID=A0A7V8FWV1_9BURK|nr:MAG: hypothetical protein GAK35_02215 [Herbaspirillum frisingense]
MTTEATAAPAAAPVAAPVATALPVAAPVAAPAAAPVEAPAATPATPATPADAGKGEAPAFGEATTYQPTGDSNLDLALAFAGRHGLGPEHPAMVEATKGNFSQVKALMAEKGIPGWEAHIALAEQGFAAFTKAEAEKTLAIQQDCIRAAGSEQEWGNVLQWASVNAEPHEKTAVNAALAQGGVVSQAMAAFLVHSYRNAPGTTQEPQRQAVNQNSAGGGAPASASGPLSPAQYAKEVAALARQGVIEGSREYAALRQRRAMWRG